MGHLPCSQRNGLGLFPQESEASVAQKGSRAGTRFKNAGELRWEGIKNYIRKALPQAKYAVIRELYVMRIRTAAAVWTADITNMSTLAHVLKPSMRSISRPWRLHGWTSLQASVAGP